MVGHIFQFVFWSTLFSTQYRERCEGFTLPRKAPGVELTRQTYYAAGDWVNLTSFGGEISSQNLTAFCRLELSITTNPLTNSTAHTEVWLPDAWNKRILGVGNGGFSGGIVYPALAYDGLLRSFATFSTDTGHSSHALDGSWALGNDDAITDFSWRSVHRSVEVLKLLTPKFYGRWRKSRVYWSGCSTGGAQGLKAAQESPKDFDGVLVGSPASDMTHLQSWSLRQNKALQDGGLDAKAFKVVHDEVLRQCDGLDGVVDGVLEDPRMCYFRPEAIVCKNGKTKKCLTKAQVKAVRRIYSDYYDDEDELFFPRSEPGGELAYHQMTPPAFPLEYFRNILLNDTEWSASSLDITTRKLATEEDVGALNAINPNLIPFAKRNGKVLHYFGWGDQNIAPQDSLRYYSTVVEHTLSTTSRKPDSFYRVFPVPGMAHCQLGEGANAFGAASQTAAGMPPFVPNSPKHDILLALVDWVEKGKKPEEVVATRWRGNEVGKGVERTRKLCVFPKRSVFLGGGLSSDAAESFKCV